MFPKVFENISNYNKTAHKALSFATTLSKTKVLNLIKKMGLDKFLTQDHYSTISDYDYSSIPTKKLYKNDRIAGIVQAHNAQCCSFTKDSSKWFLFPFTEDELKRTGVSLDDALNYIKRLNDLKVGFKYLYLGYSSIGKPAGPISMTGVNAHWFAVPKGANGTKYHYMYLHWIFLRFLVNSYSTSGVIPSLPYYNFPRIFMYLIEDLGVNPWKAFLYTQAASGWAPYYSMCYSDNTTAINIPDLGISSKQFKAIWKVGCHNMNCMISTANTTPAYIDGVAIKLQGKHDPLKSTSFIKEAKIKEFVEYMDSIYYPEKKKKVSKAKASIDGKKKVPAKRTKKAVN